MKNKVIDFNESVLKNKIIHSYNKVHVEFHELYEDCDSCLKKCLNIYSEVVNQDIKLEKKHMFKILYLILNIITEKAKEASEIKIDELNFFKSYFNIAKDYISDKYDQIHLTWLEIKSLALLKNTNLYDVIVSKYKDIENYFDKRTKDSLNTEELTKAYRNLNTVKEEIAIYLNKNNHKIYAFKYISTAMMGFISLYLAGDIEIKSLKETYNIMLNITSEDTRFEIEQIDEILSSNKIAL